MKKTLILLLLVSCFAYSQGQSCCKNKANQQFSELAMNESFAAAHLSPLPYTGEELRGKLINFENSDQSKGGAYLVEAAQPTKNWIFIFHEWWGLNDYIKHEADSLQALVGNCNVLAIDLYDGQVAEDAKAAQELSSGLDEKHVSAIIKGALGYIGQDAKIVTLGWCMGGGWSLQSSIMEGDRAIGCVIYYGMPELDSTKLGNLKCDVLGFYGQQDKYIDPKMVTEFQAALKKSNIKNTIKSYNAVHAFANPSNPKHDVAATKDSYTITLKYIKDKFKLN